MDFSSGKKNKFSQKKVRGTILIDACVTYVGTVLTKILLYNVKCDAIDYRTMMVYNRFFLSFYRIFDRKIWSAVGCYAAG